MRYFLAWLVSRFKGKWVRRYWREDYYMRTCDHIDDYGSTFVFGCCILCGQCESWQTFTASTNDYYEIDAPGGEATRPTR